MPPNHLICRSRQHQGSLQGRSHYNRVAKPVPWIDASFCRDPGAGGGSPISKLMIVPTEGKRAEGQPSICRMQLA